MTLESLVEAAREADRFIAKARRAVSRLKSDGEHYAGPRPEVAAAKRASMDLTRALAAMRHS